MQLRIIANGLGFGTARVRANGVARTKPPSHTLAAAQPPVQCVPGPFCDAVSEMGRPLPRGLHLTGIMWSWRRPRFTESPHPSANSASAEADLRIIDTSA